MVVIDDSPGLVRLAVIPARSAAGLVGAIAYFEPEDWRQVVKTEFSTERLYVRGQRQHAVAAIGTARNQDVADDAADATAGDKQTLGTVFYAALKLWPFKAA